MGYQKTPNFLLVWNLPFIAKIYLFLNNYKRVLHKFWLFSILSVPCRFFDIKCHILGIYMHQQDFRHNLYTFFQVLKKDDFFKDLHLLFMEPESTALRISFWFFKMFNMAGLEIPYFSSIFFFSNPGFFLIFNDFSFFS